MPNLKMPGDWEFLWASNQASVDRFFGSGYTDDSWQYNLCEYLLRVERKKKNRGEIESSNEGSKCEAFEIIRKAGPYPDQYNCLKGKWAAADENRLQLVFNQAETDTGNPLTFRHKKKRMVVRLMVIYASKTLAALQTEDEEGKCDFYVMKHIEDIETRRDELIGITKNETFFK